MEQSQLVQRAFYPGKTVRTLRFPNAYRGIDHREANAYLLSQSPVSDRVALYVIPDDIDYTVKMMDHRRVSALKAYYLYFDPPATKIYEFFPPEILAVASEKDLPIILHLPMMITRCQDDLAQLLKDFPQLTVVLAHLGLPHMPVPGLLETYDRFSSYPNVLMDTAMIPSYEVVDLAIRSFGVNRIMFGSDEPLHMIRSTVFHHPTLGERLATNFMYHWVNPDEHREFAKLASGAMHTQWQALQAIKRVIDSQSPKLQEQSKQCIFYHNAKEIYGF